MEKDLKSPRYNVRAVVRATGLTPDTLRVWERRYGLPHPQRTTGGHRLYSQHDVDMLRWFVAREKEGLSISRAVNLWRDLLEQGRDPLHAQRPAAMPGAPTESVVDGLRERWVGACQAFDEPRAQQALDEGFSLLPTEVVCTEVILAGLGAIGEGWYTGERSVQQEHFATEIAVRRVQRLLSATPPPVRAARLLLFCPAHEEHSFAPLLLTYLLRQNGWDAIFLGANVPPSDLQATVEQSKADLVILSAQLAATAVALLHTGRQLNALGLPFAYGGRIFNAVPSLRAKVPGHFLGETLPEAVAGVESLFVAGAPATSAEVVPEGFANTLAAHTRARAAVEAETADRLADSPLAPPHVAVANAELAAVLEAALTFGDESLLVHEVAWLEGLLRYRGIAETAIALYLRAYRESVERALGAGAGVLPEWLARLGEPLAEG